MNAGLVRRFGGASIIAAAVSIFAANAEAVTAVPDAEYYNAASMSLLNNLDFGDGGSGFTSAHLSPDPGYPASWASDYRTNNNFSIPRISATAQSGAGKGEANSALTYYVLFSGAAGDVHVDVHASGSASAQGANVLNGYGHNEASASLFIHSYVGGITGPDLVNESVSSNFRNGPTGLQTFSVNQDITFTANLVYQVVMNVYASSVGDETSYAYADPFFKVTSPGVYSVLTSSGIGNTAAVTPIPAALPLFTSGLGALGLLGWRKRRKAVSRAA